MSNLIHPPPIALLTDFGTQDAYVGTMKGVIQRIVPGVTMIDITHAVAPQDVRQAAFVLWTAYRYFPAGTVFLAVVDPGVGSERRPVAIEAGGFWFVGPDNGLFGDVLAEIAPWRAVTISQKWALADGLTSTFHGRDLFAPTAAHIAAGRTLAEIGVPLGTLVTLPPPRLEFTRTTIEGEVIYIDHFGNVITSIGTCAWKGSTTILGMNPRTGGYPAPDPFDADKAKVTIGKYHFQRIARTYTAVQPGQPTALINSAGQLEIAINQGNAARRLDLSPGMRVTIHLD